MIRAEEAARLTGIQRLEHTTVHFLICRYETSGVSVQLDKIVRALCSNFLLHPRLMSH